LCKIVNLASFMAIVFFLQGSKFRRRKILFVEKVVSGDRI